MLGRPQELRSAYAKLDRARTHLQELKRKLPPLVDPKSYAIEREPGPKPFQYLLRAHAAPPVPDDFGPIIGDVLHNLGCAVDYLAAQLVVLSGGTPNSNTSYPIHWAPPKGGVKLSGCDAVRPDLAESIRHFQHYSEGRWLGDDLYVIQQLNNFDKHNEVLVVATNVDFGWHGIPDDAESPYDSVIFQEPLKPDVVVAAYIFDSEPKYELEMNFELEVRITQAKTLTSRLKGLTGGVYYAAVDNVLESLCQAVDGLLWRYWQHF